MSETLVIWLFAGLLILTVLIVIWQASERYQERKMKKLIQFAVSEFHAGSLGSKRFFQQQEHASELIAQASQLIEKPLRDKNGKFVKK